MGETRKIAAILVADVVGYSRLAGADEERTLSRLRGLRSDLIDPAIAAHHGRIVKRTGDGFLIEFRSVVDAVRCAIEVQNGLMERNAGVPKDRRIEFRVGVHLGDVVEEADGDLMGDGVNIAARLEGICTPGAICLSEQAYWQVKGRLDLAVTDLGPTQLKNIAEPIRVYSLEVGKPAQAKPPPSMTSGDTAKPPTSKRRLGSGPLAAAIAALLLLAAASGWYILGGRIEKPAQAAHLSIVVLPFDNLSGDPAQDYFADGITDNLTTDLSRIRNSFVIARNTAITYKGKSVDTKEIGKELGVRYVLEGSVQRDQNRVRVNAQLVDAESGAHLWADRFEEDVADLFKLQDQVVLRLANTLGLELVKAEAEKGARSKNPDAIDLTMHGWTLARQWTSGHWSKEINEVGRALFQQALKIDPNNADALAGEAYTYTNEYSSVRNHETDYDEKVLGPADRAIAIAPDTLWAYYVKCVYLYYSHRADKAIDAADAGLAINPNFAPLLAVRGNANLFEGHFEQARSDILQAIRLNPRVPGLTIKYLGDAELGLGHFDAAIDDYHRAIDLGMHDMWPYASLAAASALAAKTDEAKAALAEALRLEPKLTIKWITPLAPPIPNLYEGLRKAGLAEEVPAEAKHLSIVVLPFANLSGDPSQDYFADGITENLTTDLSRIRNSFVIARNTAFTYKGKSVDAREIGRELGVRYMLEGSVQREQNRVRVNAQLIDAESGAHLWADRFDEEIADLFKLQDQIVARLTNTLGFELVKAEAVKGARSKNPDAIDLTMRGRALKRTTKDDNNAARILFEQALKIDPNDSDALAGDAATYYDEYFDWSRNSGTDYDAKILDQADRAIALAPDNVAAYEVKSWYLNSTHRSDGALRAIDAGIAMNPNAASLRAERGWDEISLGRFEQAKSDEQQAMQLSPRDPDIGVWHLALGSAELGLGHVDAAIEEFHKTDNGGCCDVASLVSLAAAYALAGKMDEAKSALAGARRIEPKLTVKWLLAQQTPNLPPLYEGLRKAGIPEE